MIKPPPRIVKDCRGTHTPGQYLIVYGPKGAERSLFSRQNLEPGTAFAVDDKGFAVPRSLDVH